MIISILLAAIAIATAPLAPETQHGLDLRARYGVEAPTSLQTVHIQSASAHHLSEDYSALATRGADGRWTVSIVGEEGPALLRIETRLIPETRKTLSAQEGEALDRLLAKTALYRQASPAMPRDIGVGAAFHTMEIRAPQGRSVIHWVGRLRGNAGRVADLVIGR